ncbi:cell growth-regulating nucleolar protein [Tiliqua scincoides]|uniref:cell growth-regulating nucleolar protein n=1 Tax=Tiliqua scincoides TaxID=71010 RepID=UPI003463554D
MVVFTCNACGESVKKAQVEKHVNLCRNCQCLSCMDCGKDFWGDDYKLHVKCISEDQKYGGKGYEAKTAKGDVKQQEWIQKIHEAIQKTKINPKVRDVLEQMYAYDNIPRKKIKFQNWMSNSLKIHNTTLQDQVWDIFSEATRKGQSETEEKQQDGKESQSAKNQDVLTSLEDDITEAEEPAKKKNKRERKEERRNLKKTKKSKVQRQQESFEKQKSKKLKREKSEDENEELSQSDSLNTSKMQQAVDVAELEMNGNGFHAEKPGAKLNMKKRKRNLSEGDCEIVDQEMDSTVCEENEEEPQGKFSWKGTIKAVLKQAPDNEISMKKLKKKVVAQYYAVMGDHHHKSEKDVWALFNKKVNSNPKFRVLKEKVKLVK